MIYLLYCNTHGVGNLKSISGIDVGNEKMLCRYCLADLLVSFCPFQLLLLPQMTQRQQLALVYFSCLIFSTDIKSLQTLYTYPLLLCISICIICVWHDNPIEIYTSWDTDAPHTHHHIDPKDRLHDLTYQILYSQPHPSRQTSLPQLHLHCT